MNSAATLSRIKACSAFGLRMVTVGPQAIRLCAISRKPPALKRTVREPSGSSGRRWSDETETGASGAASGAKRSTHSLGPLWNTPKERGESF